MGFQSTIIVSNDALHEIGSDPEFGRKVYNAVGRQSVNQPSHISCGGHSSAAQAIDSHHADGYRLLVTTNLTGYKLGSNGDWPTDKLPELKTFLNNVLAEYGWKVVKDGRKRS